MSHELKQGDTCIQILNIRHEGKFGSFDYTDAKDKKVYEYESLLAFSTQKTINLYTLYYKLKEQPVVEPIQFDPTQNEVVVDDNDVNLEEKSEKVGGKKSRRH